MEALYSTHNKSIGTRQDVCKLQNVAFCIIRTYNYHAGSLIRPHVVKYVAIDKV